MKTKIFISIAVIATALCGCSKKSDSSPSATPVAPAPSYSFTATVNGAAWSSPSNYCLARITNVWGGYYLDIQGTASNSLIMLTLFCGNGNKPVISTGNYPLWPGNQGTQNTSSVVLDIGNYSYSDLISGNLYISKVDTANKNISGTFNFNSIIPPAGQMCTVANGEFTLIHYN